jgi:hypothetical protein
MTNSRSGQVCAAPALDGAAVRVRAVQTGMKMEIAASRRQSPTDSTACSPTRLERSIFFTPGNSRPDTSGLQVHRQARAGIYSCGSNGAGSSSEEMLGGSAVSCLSKP